MKSFIRPQGRLLAVLVCLVASAASAAQGTGNSRYSGTSYRTAAAAPARTASRTSLLAEPEPIAAPPEADQYLSPDSGQSFESFDDQGGDCDDGGCAMGGCANGRFQSGLWYGTVDYLLVRPRFSQGVAEVRRTLVTDTSVSPNTSTLTDQAVEFPFKYQSSFRAALGYRLLNCGGDIQFAYWRLTGSAQVNDGPADTVNDSPFIAGQLKNNPANGQIFSATAGVTANIFDADFAKCLSLGGPQNPCDTCFCPRWDLRWAAGARIADISRFDNNLSSDPDGSASTRGDISARFVGAGPRVSLQGRRFFGQNGSFALYAKASQALLIGDFRMSRTKTTPGDAQVPTEITNQFDHYGKMVPVTDIEVGGSWQIAPYTFISAGWFFQCWWDLGQSETVIGTNFGPLDTANILGFDGLFVRGEILF